MKDRDFEALFAEHAQPLFGFLAYRTGNRALAEDILGDAFERAYRARTRFDRRKASEKTWLYTIALNCLRDHGRRAAAEGRALERVRGGEGGAEDEFGFPAVEARDRLGRAMSVLLPDERDVVALRFGAELTVPEIAAALGEPLTTVEGRVYRGLRKLRDTLG